ncbi:MAG: glycosyltransferase [Candidatus Uhrbacteria bacterium]|nr:glycosyltransferase [Candidatus Uhrbacteria bacterium]
MRIIFTGGGTLGSVTPQLVIYEELKARYALQGTSVDALWIGTGTGPEKDIVSIYHIPFVSIVAGKLRRYFSVRNFFDPFLTFAGIVQALWHIWRFRPDIIVHAAGYVGVPVLAAGYALGKKSITLQIDFQPSLSNLIGARFSSAVGIVTEKQKKYFPSQKTHIVGVPTRVPSSGEHYEELVRTQRGLRQRLGIKDGESVIMITGGGTGARSLNELVEQSISLLCECAHVIHVTGKGKEGKSEELARRHTTYHPFEFPRGEMIALEALSDVVVTRAGMGTLSELSALGKPIIIIPISKSHQEKNAEYFFSHHAALVLRQDILTPETFSKAVCGLLKDKKAREELSKSIRTVLPDNAAKRAVDMIQSVL